MPNPKMKKEDLLAVIKYIEKVKYDSPPVDKDGKPKLVIDNRRPVTLQDLFSE